VTKTTLLDEKPRDATSGRIAVILRVYRGKMGMAGAGGRAMTDRRLLLLTVSVVSLNAALLASASAETCVTGVNSTSTNAVSGITGQPGTTVVTGVTPTMAFIFD